MPKFGVFLNGRLLFEDESRRGAEQFAEGRFQGREMPEEAEVRKLTEQEEGMLDDPFGKLALKG